MKKILLFILLCISLPTFSQFISEIHYDNTGGDTGEAVEVVIPDGATCTSPSIVLYNGSNNQTYGTLTAGTPSVDPVTGATIIVFSGASIQNGAPDGLALTCGETVIEFLSYEGSFTASNGPASGQTSTDIGVSETSSTPVGSSLSRCGGIFVGTGEFGDLGFEAPAANSFGTMNDCIFLPITLASFTAELLEDTSLLKWTTLSEQDNDVIEIQRSFNGLEWDKIGEVAGQGTTDEITNYEFEDKSLVNGTTFYRLNQIDFDGTSTLSDIVSITTEVLQNIEIGAVNKQSINLTSSLEGAAIYRVFDSMGNMKAVGEFDSIKGNQSIYYRNGELASGFYIIQVEVEGEIITDKFVIQ